MLWSTKLRAGASPPPVSVTNNMTALKWLKAVLKDTQIKTPFCHQILQRQQILKLFALFLAYNHAVHRGILDLIGLEM